MIRFSCLIILQFCFAYNSVFGEYSNDDGSISSVFSSLRRTDHSDVKTYHFARVPKYEPVKDPIVYGDGYNDNSKMIVGFNNMVVFGKFENEKHYVIRVSDDLDEDTANIPSRFLNNQNNDSGELFDIVTLKPTTTTTTPFPRFDDIVKNAQREALPGFDADTQSLTDYLQQVAVNMSRLVESTQSRQT